MIVRLYGLIWQYFYAVTSQPRLDYLISKGADINARDSLGNTPLFLVDDAGLDWADNLLTSPQLGKFMNHVNFKITEYSFAEDYIFKGSIFC